MRPLGAAAPDTLMRGARVVLRGDVVNADGSPALDYQGQAAIHVYDSEIRRDESVECFGTGFSATYNLTGATILRQTAAVTNGRFEIAFVTPSVLRSGEKGWGQIYAFAPAEDRRRSGGRAATA